VSTSIRLSQDVTTELPQRFLLQKLSAGVFREPGLDSDSLIVWVRLGLTGSTQQWWRVSTNPGSKAIDRRGIHALPATGLHAVQPARGFWRTILSRFMSAQDNQTWILPTGETVKQCGERETDLVVVWAQDDSICLDAAHIRSQWPESRHAEKLGHNLFVVAGVKVANGRPATDSITAT